jgi:predicted alpha/beta hydrolase family esterase
LTYVFLAGIDNSGPDHWQSLWRERFEEALWVEHTDWHRPDRDTWVADLDAALRSIVGQKLVVAHSLGCLLIAEWARDHIDTEIAGAFLVAVPDIESPALPPTISGFRPAFENTLPCPALLVASEDDPYAGLDYARRLAARWQARFVNLGCKGHINAASQLGQWQEGLKLLREFEAGLPIAAGGEGTEGER